MNSLGTVGTAKPAHNPRKSTYISLKNKGLRKAADAFEAAFIAEMLKSAGAGKARESFGGGAGENAFSSFLVSSQADKIVEGGGFGLSEKIFQALKATKTHA